MKLRFPHKGIHKGMALAEQPGDTSPNMNNVRPYDTLDNRMRGGQRPGIDKLYTQQIGGASEPIIAICQVQALEDN